MRLGWYRSFLDAVLAASYRTTEPATVVVESPTPILHLEND